MPDIELFNELINSAMTVSFKFLPYARDSYQPKQGSKRVRGERSVAD
jgi:hypothetical protein